MVPGIALCPNTQLCLPGKEYDVHHGRVVDVDLLDEVCVYAYVGIGVLCCAVGCDGVR